MEAGKYVPQIYPSGNFPKRMKNVGLYGVLIQNSIQKTSWKQFGFLKFDEQMNLILQ